MSPNRLRCIGLALAILVAAVACTEDQRPADFSFEPGGQDAAADVGPDVGPGGPTAFLQLFHSARGQSLSSSDIYLRVQDELTFLADDFEFGRYSSFLALPAGVPWDLVMASSRSANDGTLQSDEILATVEDIELDANTQNLAILHGFEDTEGSQRPPFDVAIRRDMMTTPGQDAVNGLLFHDVPGLPVVDMSPSNAYEEWIIFDDVGYGNFSEDVEQFSQPDVFDFYTDDGVFVTNIQPPPGVEPTFGGGVLTGVFIGGLTTQTQNAWFEIAAFSNNPDVVGTAGSEDFPVGQGQPATELTPGARVRFVNATSDPQFETVDLEIGAEPETVTDLSFSETSDFLSLPAGTTISVDISGDGTSIQRKFTVGVPVAGLPSTKIVYIAGNGQSRPVQLRTSPTDETDRFAYTDSSPTAIRLHVFHGVTTESYATVDISFADRSNGQLRGPVEVEYGEPMGASISPVSDLGALTVALGQSELNFDLGPIRDGSCASIFLADAPTALGMAAYALVDEQEPVELQLQ